MDIFNDIETIPTQNPELIAKIKSSISPPKTIKKPESIDKWMADEFDAAFDKEYRKTALNPTYGEILSLGWAIDDHSPQCLLRKKEDPEKELLEEFFSRIKDDVVSLALQRDRGRPPVWIGHNITGFDLRYIFLRSVVCDVKPSIRIPYDAKPWSDTVFDTMIEWKGVGQSIISGSQDAVCTALGIPGKGDLDGSKIWDAVLEERYADIADYQIYDVETVRKIYKRMHFTK